MSEQANILGLNFGHEGATYALWDGTVTGLAT
jgi:hypothetical protein